MIKKFNIYPRNNNNETQLKRKNLQMKAIYIRRNHNRKPGIIDILELERVYVLVYQFQFKRGIKQIILQNMDEVIPNHRNLRILRSSQKIPKFINLKLKPRKNAVCGSRLFKENRIKLKFQRLIHILLFVYDRLDFIQNKNSFMNKHLINAAPFNQTDLIYYFQKHQFIYKIKTINKAYSYFVQILIIQYNLMLPEYYEIDIYCFEVKSQASLAKTTSTLDLFELLTIKFLNMQGNSKDYQFFLPTFNKNISIDGTTLNRILGDNEKCVFELKRMLQQDLQTTSQSTLIKQEKVVTELKDQFEKRKFQLRLIIKIRSKSIEEQIDILNKELKQLDNNKNLTNNQKQYLKHQYQQQLITKLKDYGKTKSIPHVKQNIEVSNPELALFVLKESLLRDQNRELLATSKQYSFGFDSIIEYYGQDQYCLKVRNTNLDYDKIVNDNQLLQQHLLEFKQKLSSSLNISTDQIEILGVSKGSLKICFNIIRASRKWISQQFQNPEAKKFLYEYCNGNVDYVEYFHQANSQSKGVTLSFDDLNPSHNMSWDNFHEKQRGPPYHRYDYYFPIGCYGFGLNVEKQVKEHGNDWLKMDGNPKEWRIMYHGTNQGAVNSIIKTIQQVVRNNIIKMMNVLMSLERKLKLKRNLFFK